MKRRDFIKYAAGGLSALAVSNGLPWFFKDEAFAQVARGQTINLNITDAIVEMVDLQQVYHWRYKIDNDPLLSVTGPVIRVARRERITLNITNSLDEPHAFFIPGVVDSGPIAPGETRQLRFRAPASGTYLYYDNLNGPVNRVLGLHGAFIVHPRRFRRRNATPYDRPTPAVRQLFTDLGSAEHFPGEQWRPDRERIWLFSDCDPRWNAIAEAGGSIDANAFMEDYVPKYFTINGHSGFFASHDPATYPSAMIGQPFLIRLLQAGNSTQAPHNHGNHIYVLARNGVVERNVFYLDTTTLIPLDREDWLLPYIMPVDIPVNAPWPPIQEMSFIRGDVGNPVSLRPLEWPMHSHLESSQPAAGGNYPLGLVTHWEVTGDARNPNNPIVFPIRN
jgi:FtsP/CotA-like multicopper oxidase with cupredoxin domain